jgi:hypothetical protein
MTIGIVSPLTGDHEEEAPVNMYQIDAAVNRAIQAALLQQHGRGDRYRLGQVRPSPANERTRFAIPIKRQRDHHPAHFQRPCDRQPMLGVTVSTVTSAARNTTGWWKAHMSTRHNGFRRRESGIRSANHQ